MPPLVGDVIMCLRGGGRGRCSWCGSRGTCQKGLSFSESGPDSGCFLHTPPDAVYGHHTAMARGDALHGRRFPLQRHGRAQVVTAPSLGVLGASCHGCSVAAVLSHRSHLRAAAGPSRCLVSRVRRGPHGQTGAAAG